MEQALHFCKIPINLGDEAFMYLLSVISQKAYWSKSTQWNIIPFLVQSQMIWNIRELSLSILVLSSATCLKDTSIMSLTPPFLLLSIILRVQIYSSGVYLEINWPGTDFTRVFNLFVQFSHTFHYTKIASFKRKYKSNNVNTSFYNTIYLNIVLGLNERKLSQ